ncbi:hypothetical protein L083_7317 [Actinoplanes sp. N902-109]|nr:hypothetical protein L083_7317 [Actinoplanes sp. N902-109]
MGAGCAMRRIGRLLSGAVVGVLVLAVYAMVLTRGTILP